MAANCELTNFFAQVAVCNLASISLKAFVDEEALAAGKLGVEAFDHEKLCEITKIVTCVLNIWRHSWSFLLPGCCALVGSVSSNSCAVLAPRHLLVHSTFVDSR